MYTKDLYEAECNYMFVNKILYLYVFFNYKSCKTAFIFKSWTNKRVIFFPQKM